VPIGEVRADEERHGIVAQLVPDVTGDFITQAIQRGAQILPGEQGSATVKPVELAGFVPCLADAVGIEQQPLAWAEADGSSLARADCKLG
jgi:hypothetical protein